MENIIKEAERLLPQLMADYPIPSPRPKILKWSAATEEQRATLPFDEVTKTGERCVTIPGSSNYLEERKEYQKERIRRMFKFILEKYGYITAMKFLQSEKYANSIDFLGLEMNTILPRCRLPKSKRQCDFLCYHFSQEKCQCDYKEGIVVR